MQGLSFFSEPTILARIKPAITKPEGEGEARLEH